VSAAQAPAKTGAREGRFAGKVALVTGASSGIGRAVALGLAEEGARVGLLARSREALAAVVEEIGGENAVALAADVRVADEVEAAARALTEAFGGLDLLVHSAGVSWPGKKVEDLSEDEWDMLVDTNLKSCFLLARCAIPLMRARGGGAVVNVTSAMGASSAATDSPYSTAKAGANMFTRAAALECAAEGIRFNAVAPGIVRTPMVEADGRRSDLGPEAFEKSIEKLMPLGRLIESPEVVSLVLFLLSEEASAVTGGIHNVDGGWTAQINVGKIS